MENDAPPHHKPNLVGDNAYRQTTRDRLTMYGFAFAQNPLARLSLGPKMRHFAVIIVALIGTVAFLESRADWSEMHRWNRAFGDMSLVLIACSMAIGPLSRLWRPFRHAVPWRRETGIYGVFLAIIHTIIILDGWVAWDIVRLFGFEIHPSTGTYVMVQQGFSLANAIGIAALLYGIVLAVTSNNRCQRLLGGSIWKFVQLNSYVLWTLIVVHTAYFLFIHFVHFHRPLPDPNWAQLPFVGLVLVVMVLQIMATLKTWIARRNSTQSVRA